MLTDEARAQIQDDLELAREASAAIDRLLRAGSGYTPGYLVDLQDRCCARGFYSFAWALSNLADPDNATW